MCKVKHAIFVLELMSSNENYQQCDHHLIAQTQPKSILKKSPSPQCSVSMTTTNESLLASDSTTTRKNTERNEKFIMQSSEENDEHSVAVILSPNHDHQEAKENDIDKNRTRVYTSNNDHNQISGKSAEKKLGFFSVKAPLDKLLMVSRQDVPLELFTNETNASQMTDSRTVGTNPISRADSSSSSFTSDDEQQSRRQKHAGKLKSNKRYSRPMTAVTGTLSSSPSSSDNHEQGNNERQTGPLTETTTKRPNNYSEKDMQLDEFMRKYQQQGGLCVPPTDNLGQMGTTTTPTRDLTNDDRSNHQPSISQGLHVQQLTKPQSTSSTTVKTGYISNDTMGILQSINKMTQPPSAPISHLQLLFDVARTCHMDRRTKIDRIRHYVEEHMGISAFLTIYKLLKSSHVLVDIRQSPFCHYAPFIPHLCCLIMLESEQKNNRIIK